MDGWINKDYATNCCTVYGNDKVGKLYTNLHDKENIKKG